MTAWPEDDAEGDFDFMDPTDVDGNESESWSPAEVPDGSTEHDFLEVVHIWLTPEKRLAKIRISNRWRERLKDRTLSSVVSGAMFMNQLSPSEGQSTSHQSPDIGDVRGTVDQSFLNQWLESLASSADRLRKFAADSNADQGHWVGSENNKGVSRNGKVTVKLGKRAATTRVTIDEEWAKLAQVSEICDAVLEAHGIAYQNYSEPTFVPGEASKIGAELASMKAELHARLANSRA